jgi:hypothetical protein
VPGDVAIAVSNHGVAAFKIDRIQGWVGMVNGGLMVDSVAAIPLRPEPKPRSMLKNDRGPRQGS